MQIHWKIHVVKHETFSIIRRLVVSSLITDSQEVASLRKGGIQSNRNIEVDAELKRGSHDTLYDTASMIIIIHKF